VLKGKFPYLAPERVRGAAGDRRSDVFSLGVVAFEMTTRRRLFWRDNEFSTLEAVVAAKVPPLWKIDAAVPPEWDAAVRRALARLPEGRFQRASDLGRALVQAASAVGLSADQRGLARVVSQMWEPTPVSGHPKADSVTKSQTLPFIVSPDFAADRDGEEATTETQPGLDPVPSHACEPTPAPASASAEPAATAAEAEFLDTDEEHCLAAPLPPRADSRPQAATAAEKPASPTPSAPPPPRDPRVASKQAAPAGPKAAYRLPPLPSVTPLVPPRESLGGCLAYTWDVVRMKRERRRALAVLADEVALLEREKGDLLVDVGKRLEEIADSVDRSVAGRLGRLGPSHHELTLDQRTSGARREAAYVEAKLPELRAAVSEAEDEEVRHAAKAILVFAEQRLEQLRAAAAKEPDAGAARSRDQDADRRKLLADLGRIAWKARAAPERAGDLYRALDRREEGLESCRREDKAQRRLAREFETRPITVAAFTVLVPLAAAAVLVALLLMSGAAG
jgi:hypothetical protein